VAIERFSEQFGTALQFCPRKRPWYKGRIERFFGTLNTSLLHKLPGTTFSNIFQRGSYDSKKHAVLTLATLKELVATWIVDVYHQSYNKGLENTPQKEWNSLIDGQTRLLPESAAWLDMAFSKRIVGCKSDHAGLKYDSIRYNGPQLRAIREAYGTDVVLDMYTNDEEIGSVHVMLPDTGEIVEIPAVDQEYARGLSRWQHKTIKRYKRLLSEQSDDELVSLEEAKCRIRDLISADRRTNKKHGGGAKVRFTEQVNAVESGRSGFLAEAQPQPQQPEPAVDASNTQPGTVIASAYAAVRRLGGRIKGAHNAAA
jgi:putative transposase